MKKVALKENMPVVVVKDDGINKEITGAVAKATALQIVDSASYEISAEMLLGLKGLIKKAQEFMAPLKKATRDAWQRTIDREKELVTPLEEAIGVLEPKRREYLDKMEELRKKLELELHKQAQEELEREKQKDAELAMAMGDEEGAKAILQEEREVKVPVVAPLVPKVKGVSERVEWKCAVVDADKIPRQFLAPDFQRIASYVRLMKDKASIPGVKTWPQPITMVRTKQ